MINYELKWPLVESVSDGIMVERFNWISEGTIFELSDSYKLVLFYYKMLGSVDYVKPWE